MPESSFDEQRKGALPAECTILGENLKTKKKYIHSVLKELLSTVVDRGGSQISYL